MDSRKPPLVVIHHVPAATAGAPHCGRGRPAPVQGRRVCPASNSEMMMEWPPFEHGDFLMNGWGSISLPSVGGAT